MTAGRPEPLRAQLAKVLSDCLPADSLSVSDRTQLLMALEQILEAAKLESLAEFAAGAGHEINNPVSTIAGRAQLLLGGESDAERRHALEIIGSQALRIRDMIGDVMLFARPPVPRPERLDLLALVQQAADSQAELQAQRNAQIKHQIPADKALWGDRTQVLVVLSSLLRNSLEAADRPGITINVSVRNVVHDRRQWSVVTVQDDGPGISAEVREHLFDPFYSGRPAGRGLGFGLSKCWRIAQLHGGQIRVVEAAKSGTAIEVWWPDSNSSDPRTVSQR